MRLDQGEYGKVIKYIKKTPHLLILWNAFVGVQLRVSRDPLSDQQAESYNNSWRLQQEHVLRFANAAIHQERGLHTANLDVH